MLKKKKTEGLSEAFGKGIRDFTDDEWGALNGETLDRIKKIKAIDVISDKKLKGKKADVKKWADSGGAQALADEERDNEQHDELAARADQQELNKYNSPETLDSLKIDFENCIRDQVEMVMQEYQSYDEINPEYEGEDIIMKAA